MPLPGSPQEQAYDLDRKVDVIGYGGAAGGGKTDLACGLALTQHKKTAIFRRESTQLEGIYQRLEELVGSKDGFNGSNKIWRGLPGDRIIEFGSVPNPGDETKYQGRPKDLLVIDEAANLLELQARFIMGWVRTTDPHQHCTTLLTFNPPTTAEGQWVISFFAPWLQENHPDPAMPGEIRYVGVVDSQDVWVDRPDEFVLVDGKPVYEFDRRAYAPEDIIRPQSRTFIPSKISDNPFLLATGYVATLQALPEPLRSQMLRGDFKAGMEDDVWQTIPSDWVRAAQERWKIREATYQAHGKPIMDSVGVDVARGGSDKTVIYPLYEGLWFDRAVAKAGRETPDGQTLAALVLSVAKHQAPIHIDIIGPGASGFDFLRGMGIHTIGCMGSEATSERDQTGRFGFYNFRTMIWWRMREALDPLNNTGIALPPDPTLAADLCAPTWKLLKGGVIQLETKEDLVKRIGRSPDFGDAACMALVRTPKRNPGGGQGVGKVESDWDPFNR